MKSEVSKSFNDLNSSIQEYLKIHLELFRLSVLEKMTKMTVMIISSMYLLLMGTFLLLFGSTAFILWYGAEYNDYLSAVFMVMGFLVFLILMFLVARKSIVTKGIIKRLSEIIYENED